MNATKEVKFKITLGYHIKYFHRLLWQPKKQLFGGFGKPYYIDIKMYLFSSGYPCL